MSYQTGTLANINDVLNTFATFLSAAGWTIFANWREEMVVGTTGGGGTLTFRYGRRLFASKGNKFVGMQDFYLGPKDIQYGTNGGFKIGPGIALTMGTAFAAGWDGTDGSRPPSGAPSLAATFASQVTNAPGSDSGVIRTLVMPLPAVTGQTTGSYATPSGPAVSDGTLAAPFGIPGGAAVPMKYWMFADGTGDNVVLVVLHDDARATIAKTTYLCFGDLPKAGNWTGTGCYFGASHGNDGAFDDADGIGHSINRFGPPGSVMDGLSCTFLVRADVDTTPAGRWPAICNVAVHPGTGRRLTSTAHLWPKDHTAIAGYLGGGIQYQELRKRGSSLANAAPGLPIQILVERDNSLVSVVGRLPNIYQSVPDGFSFGTETLAANGDTMVVFDGFTVKKVP